MILFCIGVANLLLQTNMIKKVLGVNIMNSGVCLLLAALGCQGLALTGVAVSAGATALALALTVRLYELCDTLNIDEALVVLARKASLDESKEPDASDETDELEDIDLSFEIMRHLANRPDGPDDSREVRP